MGTNLGTLCRHSPQGCRCQQVYFSGRGAEVIASWSKTHLNRLPVRVAYDGPAALTVAQAQRPNVILLDIGMPKIDGYHVARRLREQPETQDATIVAVTGYGMDGDKERAKAAGFDFHILKPVDATELFSFFREARPNKPR